MDNREVNSDASPVATKASNAPPSELAASAKFPSAASIKPLETLIQARMATLERELTTGCLA